MGTVQHKVRNTETEFDSMAVRNDDQNGVVVQFMLGKDVVVTIPVDGVRLTGMPAIEIGPLRGYVPGIEVDLLNA